MSSEIIGQERREFLPAAGHDLFLPLYDPLVSLLGGDRAQGREFEMHHSQRQAVKSSAIHIEQDIR